jgi:hypothetical protein
MSTLGLSAPMLIERCSDTVVANTVAGVALLCASVSVCAFEAVGKVISVSTSREIVNEPYESCPSPHTPAGANTPPAPACHQVDHYDVRTMYHVAYEYHGQRFTAKLPYDPGPELRIEVSVTPQ